jgi:predicted nucleic acid-binding protein
VRIAIEEGAIASWINLGEVLYIEIRRHGEERASAVVESLAEQLAHVEDADAELTRAAARIKAGGGVSYADCFAVATAERHAAPLLTGDPELLAIEHPGLTVVDLTEPTRRSRA